MALQVGGETFWVLGLARSGCAAGALLRRHGAVVVGIDDTDDAAVRRRWEREGLSKLAPGAFDEILTGGGWPSRPPAAVIVSPGVPLTHPRLAALAGTVPILGELELGARFCRARQVAVTGTNGKSTTTEWIAHLARKGGLRAEGCGNLGRPLCALAEELGPRDVAVVEVSSFQLETVSEFQPQVGVVLNLAPDHLDRYPDLAAYYAAKQVLAGLVPSTGTFVTWTGCPEAVSWPTAAARLLFGERALGAGVCIEDGSLQVRQADRTRAVLPVSGLSLQSPPNLLNAQAALAAGVALGLDLEALAAGLGDFPGLTHRHQLVGRLGGVDFINDTKATNVHAVCAGLRGYPRPVVLIAGGSGKGEDFAPLAGVMQAVRHVVLIGQEGPRIGRALQGTAPLSSAATLEEAVARAAALAAAEPPAVVLLSPACASFDMFANYAARGEAFAAAVRGLGAEMVAPKV